MLLIAILLADMLTAALALYAFVLYEFTVKVNRERSRERKTELMAASNWYYISRKLTEEQLC